MLVFRMLFDEISQLLAHLISKYLHFRFIIYVGAPKTLRLLSEVWSHLRLRGRGLHLAWYITKTHSGIWIDGQGRWAGERTKTMIWWWREDRRKATPLFTKSGRASLGEIKLSSLDYGKKFFEWVENTLVTCVITPMFRGRKIAFNYVLIYFG